MCFNFRILRHNLTIVLLNISYAIRRLSISLTSKDNLHHHLSVVHPEQLKKFLESKQIPRDQATIESTAGNLMLRTYSRQEQVTKSLAQHLIAQGGLPVSVVEQNWFRSFLNEVLPNYQIP